MSSSPDRLTILHVVSPARVGGLEQVLVNLAGGHVASGHRVHAALMLTSDEQTHPVAESLRAAQVEVHVGVASARAYTRERAIVADLCTRIRPDVVHTHGYRPDVIDGGVARKLGIPTVSTVHGFTRNGVRGRSYEWLQRRWLRDFEAVVAVSSPQVTELVRSGVRAERVRLLRNAWVGARAPLSRAEARAALGISQDAFHVGWVGRLTPEKGPDILIDALAQLNDLEMTVSILGTGRDSEKLRTDAQAHTHADIRWHGLVPEAARLCSAFDVFVLSSRTEGTPIALLEAIAAGVPVVATAVGGVPDVLSYREGLLVEPGNVAALAKAIRQVHDDPDGAAHRAGAARARLAREFAREPWLAAYEALYRELRSPRTTNGTDKSR